MPICMTKKHRDSGYNLSHIIMAYIIFNLRFVSFMVLFFVASVLKRLQLLTVKQIIYLV